MLAADSYATAPASQARRKRLGRDEAICKIRAIPDGRFSMSTVSLQSSAFFAIRLIDAEFTRKDWLVYISNLPQRAGVIRELIRRLVLKELVDNALDEMDRVGRPGEVTITQDGEHTYTVTDQGRGFRRFARRARLPILHREGDGKFQAVAQADPRLRGQWVARDRRRRCQRRRPHRRQDAQSGDHPAAANGRDDSNRGRPTIDWPTGTAITVEIDPAYPADGDPMQWAQLAIELARSSGPPFTRQPSPYWFDADHLALNMLSALPPDKTLAWFVGKLDRCTDRAIGQRITERFGKGRLCRDVSKPQAAQLLALLREHTCEKRIKPKQLGPMGREAWKCAELNDGYAFEEGTFNDGDYYSVVAQIPFLVEAWAATCEPPASMDDDDDDVYAVEIVGLHHQPVAGDYSLRRGPDRPHSRSVTDLRWYTVLCSVPKGAFDIAVNITSPHIHILGDNKTPALECFTDAHSSRDRQSDQPIGPKQPAGSRLLQTAATAITVMMRTATRIVQKSKARREQVLSILAAARSSPRPPAMALCRFNQRLALLRRSGN